MTRVTAPSRLHFGLFHVPDDRPARWPGLDGTVGAPVRAFGGVGLMIDQPGVVVTARPATSWQFEGTLASRAQVFAHRYLEALPAPARPSQLLVEQCPAEHTGLGVGTQLGLAVARALALETGYAELSAVQLAQRVGRGERSAIGVHGFDRGGLIVEPGKVPGETVSPLLTRVLLPTEWRVAVFAPHGRDRWHGSREQGAFAKAVQTPRPPGLTDTLCRIALLGILPAAVAGDLPAFGEAVHEFNRRAGEPFAEAQGGAYAGPEVAGVIAAVRRLGVRGVGQSSWGPAVFAFVNSQDQAGWLVQQLRGTARGWVAKPSEGHRVERD
ncbi:MAG: beta-RFAP synthase [Gemmataceae bacterium]|nr:beta-RFAP synthase [Gemmataceae bacterium]